MFVLQDEPLNTYLNLGECKELEIWSTQSIKEGCSFKAINSDGEIIGIFLNGLLTKPVSIYFFNILAKFGHILNVLNPQGKDYVHVNAADDCKHKKFKTILSLMDHIESNFNFFDLYPEYDTALDGRILSVNEKYRGLGIAGALTRRTIEYMQENKIPLYHILCSSHFSAKVCERLGFKQLYQLPYLDYLVNGENPLKPAPPHLAATVYVKKIDL